MRARHLVLREVLGNARVRSHSGAFHAWIGMTNDWSADAFVRAAEQRGVAVTPGLTFQVGPFADSNAIRVYLNAAEDQVVLRAALQHLADLLLDQSARTTSTFRSALGAEGP